MSRYDYTQPFYVPVGKGKINPHTGKRGGYYLPALEPKEEIKPLITPMQLWDNKQWDAVQQLKAENKHLSKKLFTALNKLNTHITALKKKKSYKEYKS